MHSYEHPDLSITSPSGGIYNTALPITWVLNNPDDGRPIKYDLEYSIDNQANFLPIVSGLDTASYLWSNPTISNNDEVWFKITAYSIDGMLTSTIISDSASTATLLNSTFQYNEVNIFPNPVVNSLHIDFKNETNGSYKIYDLNGKLIF